MDSQVWVSCDVRDDKFGEEVPAELVEAGLLAESGGRGMVEWDGSVRCGEGAPRQYSGLSATLARGGW